MMRYLKLSNAEHVCKWHGHNGCEHAIQDCRMRASKNLGSGSGCWAQKARVARSIQSPNFWY